MAQLIIFNRILYSLLKARSVRTFTDELMPLILKVRYPFARSSITIQFH